MDGLPHIWAGVAKRAASTYMVFRLPQLARCPDVGTIKNDIVDGFHRHRKRYVSIHPAQHQQQSILNLSEIAEGGTGGARTETRRVGKEWGSTCRSRWSKNN